MAFHNLTENYGIDKLYLNILDSKYQSPQEDEKIIKQEIQWSQSFDKPISFLFVNLTSQTVYNYFLTSDSVKEMNQKQLKYQQKFLNNYMGKFKTYSDPGIAFNFSFSFGSCARTFSQNQVFSSIGNDQDTSFFIQLGDIHYSDIEFNKTELFDKAYEQIFQNFMQRQLYQKKPIVYIWDDHDFGVNNANKDNKARLSALQSYKKNVPHYDLVDSLLLYQKFVVGKSVFLLLDSRSESDQQSQIGQIQREWLFQNLDDLQNSSQTDLIFIISTVPFVDKDWQELKDSQIILKKIQDFQKNSVKRIFIISGDSHMTALAYEPNYQIINVIGAPLDQNPSCKSAFPLIKGPFQGRGQYSKIIVDYQNETNFCVKIQGKKLDTTLYEHIYCNDDPQKYFIDFQNIFSIKCQDSISKNAIQIGIVIGIFIIFFIFVWRIKKYFENLLNPNQNSNQNLKFEFQEISENIPEEKNIDFVPFVFIHHKPQENHNTINQNSIQKENQTSSNNLNAQFIEGI